MKELYIDEGEVQEETLKAFFKEIAIISTLKHENIIRFFGIASDGDRLYIVTVSAFVCLSCITGLTGLALRN